MRAIILPSVGTVCLKTDGAVAFINRAHDRHEIPADVVRAICDLVRMNEPKPRVIEHSGGRKVREARR